MTTSKWKQQQKMQQKEFTSSVKEGGLFSKQMNHGLKRNKAQSAGAESTRNTQISTLKTSQKHNKNQVMYGNSHLACK